MKLASFTPPKTTLQPQPPLLVLLAFMKVATTVAATAVETKAESHR
jgi:hypothetical protein